MRFKADDAADQQDPPRRGHSARSASRHSTRPPSESVFVPGYDSRRGDPDENGFSNGEAGTPGPAWYGSTAGGPAGKGPVRGYPPAPGQPPPMYPPGQFAAWNRGRRGQRHDDLLGPGHGPLSGGREPGDRQQHASHPGASQLGASASQPRVSRPGMSRPGSIDTGLPGTNRAGYYGRDSDTDPGYSMLAVSDPAADVTSTQTWRAAGDDRATGTWTMPARPGPGSRPAGDTSAAPRPAVARQPTALSPHQPTAAHPAAPLAAPPDPGTGAGANSLTSGRHTGQRAAFPASSQSAATHSGTRTGPRPGQRTRRKRQGNVKLAIAGALLLVLAACAALAYGILRNPAKPKLASPPPSPRTTPSASPTPTLGPYGHIASRAADPAPLTVAQLFPASFKAGSNTIVRTVSRAGTACTSDVVGSNLQSAVSAAGCTQVVRATYLSAGQKLMATIGVLNLRNANAAKTAAHSAGASDFIGQLPGHSGPTSKIGSGTGIEEAAAKGHYLILIWAQNTSLRKPRTAAQRTALEQFMTALLQNTANVSLTSRMLTGTP